MKEGGLSQTKVFYVAMLGRRGGPSFKSCELEHETRGASGRRVQSSCVPFLACLLRPSMGWSAFEW